MKLVLYHFESCPFCVRVRRFISDNGLSVQEKDIHKDPQAHQELIRVGEKSQVPCLFIDGKPLYESSDIIDFLKNLSREGDRNDT